MAINRFPPETTVSAEDFRNCGWKAAIEAGDFESTHHLHSSLAAAAKHASSEGRYSHGRVLYLLSDAIGLMLDSANEGRPLRGHADFGDRRSAIPEDFSEEDLNFLASIINEIDEPRIRARVGDLIWIRMRKLGTAPPLAAIDAYTETQITHESWSREVFHYWNRALSLTRRLKTPAGQRATDIAAKLTAAFQACSNGQNFYPRDLAKLLLASAIDPAFAVLVTDRLMVIGQERFADGDHLGCRAYTDLAAETYKTLGQPVKAAEALALNAASWAREVDDRAGAGDMSGLLGLQNFNKAIETYRSIPRVHRAALDVDRHIAELEARLTASGEQALEMMTAVRTPGVDISEFRAEAQKAVAGLEPMDALLALVQDVGDSPDVPKLRASVEESLQGSFRGLFESVFLAGDGRVIARQPAAGFAATATGDDANIRFEMVRGYMIHVGLVAQAEVLPALEVIHLEHGLSEIDFIQIARDSPVVPNSRAVMVGKALYAGYVQDFGTAVYLLAPQIEHIVRMHFKSQGISTTHLKGGIENEVGLSSLLEKEEAKQYLAEDLKFELEALFCDATGPNFRNKVAHGLVADYAAYGPEAVYAWWFAMRLILLTTLRHREADGPAGEEGPAEPSQPETPAT